MAKTIRFPLEMKNGEMVRTIEALREAFDPEKLIAHFANGKLQTWLSDRHYLKELELVSVLKVEDEELLQKLCTILQIEVGSMEIQVEDVLRRRNLEKELRQFTDDEKIWNHLELVATTQEQFEELINTGQAQIYLFGDIFSLPRTITNAEIYGINNPELKIDTDEIIDFRAVQVEITGCRFSKTYEALLEKRRIEEETTNKRKRREYHASQMLDYKLSDDARKESEKLFHVIQEELLEFEFDIDAGSRKIYQVLEQADIWDLFDIDRYGFKLKQTIEKAELDKVGDSFFQRIS